jgi:hypothetical protein
LRLCGRLLRHHQRPELRVRGQYSLVRAAGGRSLRAAKLCGHQTDEVQPRPRHQRGQPLHELQRAHDHYGIQGQGQAACRGRTRRSEASGSRGPGCRTRGRRRVARSRALRRAEAARVHAPGSPCSSRSGPRPPAPGRSARQLRAAPRRRSGSVARWPLERQSK